MIDMHLLRDQIARIPKLTDAQARYLVAQLRSALQKAEAAATRARASAPPRPCATGMGVVGILAR